MTLEELVARHASDERRPSTAIVVGPSAGDLAPMLTGAPVRSWDAHRPHEGETRTLVEVVAPGQERQQVAALSAVLGDTDVALLLFSQPPETLPVGLVTDTLTTHGLTVLEACGLSHRSGRTTLAVSRDAERRQRAYLSGTPIPDDEAGRLRQRNEWLVEGLQTRSLLLLLQRRLDGQDAELVVARTERRRLEQEVTDAGGLSARLKVLGAELLSTQKALSASELQLAASQKAHAVSQKARAATESRLVASEGTSSRPSEAHRTARLLAADSVRGTGRLVRAIAQRLRR